MQDVAKGIKIHFGYKSRQLLAESARKIYAQLNFQYMQDVEKGIKVNLGYTSRQLLATHILL